MAVTSELVRELRDQTGAGVMDCKTALEATSGDLTKAIEFLRKKGLADAQKRVHREAHEGLIGTYIHPGGKLGVLVELNCETDFVARTDGFRELLKDLTMQVAATNPTYVSREEVPGEVIEREREIYRQQLADQKKPPQVVDKIVEGKLEKFFSESCLLDQPFVKDASGKTKVKELISQASAKVGERVMVRRFSRFVVGESS